MADLNFARAVSTWQLDIPVALVLAILLLGYGVGRVRVRRAGGRWPWWRTAAFVVLGVGSVALCTMSFLAAYNRSLAWCLPVQLTFLLTLAPFCFGLGDPIGLLRAALSPRGRDRAERVMASRPVRFLTFPLTAAVLAAVTLMVVFFTGYLRAAMESPAVMSGLYLQALLTGSLLALPLMGVELLPAWVGDGLKMLFASVDGLLDALPGIFVMSSGGLLAGGWFAHHRSAAQALHDQHLGGVLMLVLSEVVAVPLLCVVFARWVRNDHAAARERDRELDRIEAGRAAPQGSASEPERLKPWWEQ